MRQRKEDSKARERNLEEQLAAESCANQELQVRFASKFSLHITNPKTKLSEPRAEQSFHNKALVTYAACIMH